MPRIVLTDSDRHLLRQCPFKITVYKTDRRTKNLARMQQIRRLWSARLLRGDVDGDGDCQTLRITLTEDGRKALGRPDLATAHG